MGKLKTLFAEDLTAADGAGDLFTGSLDTAMDEGKAFFFVKRLVRKEVIHDAGSGPAERVCKDAVKPDSGNGHGVLVTVFLGRAHTRELEAVSGKLAEGADVGGRDEGSLDNVKAEQISYPFRIAFVGLFAFDGFHIFGVCKAVCHGRRRKGIVNKIHVLFVPEGMDDAGGHAAPACLEV